MRLINKSRRTGKTTQLIYASAITGFRIIAPNADMANHIEKMAKDMGIKILPPMSDLEYRNRKNWTDHTPILIDEVQNQILDAALELYFNAPVVAATMTVPIDDDCIPPTPKPLVWDHAANKLRPSIGTAEVQEDGSVKIKLKTNRDVLNEVFGHLMFKVIKTRNLREKLIVQSEDGKDLNYIDWLNSVYVKPKKESKE